MALSRGKLLLQMSLQKQSEKRELTDNNNNISEYTNYDAACKDFVSTQLPAQDSQVENIDENSELTDDNNNVSEYTNNDAACNYSTEISPKLPAQNLEAENVGEVINQGLSVLSNFECADSQLQVVSELIATELEEEQFYDFDDTLHDPDFQPPGESGDSLSSDNSDVIDHEEIVETDVNVSQKRTKKKSESKRKIAKRLRMEGEKYKGLKKVDGKWSLHVEKPERILTPRNCSKRCGKPGIKQCSKISENDRKVIFSNFWKSMNWDERKVYVNSLVASEAVNEKTVENSRRRLSYRYFLRVDGERLCVCKNMFLSTLGIGERTVYGWVNKSTSGIPEKSTSSEGRKRAQAERHSELRESVRSFLLSLPKMESHYCRSSTSKLYLEPVFDTFSALYREYKKQCVDKVASRRLLEEEFERMNLGLYKPKKDQCDVCCSHQVGSISDEQFEAHQQRKVAARAEKDRDKELAQSDTSIRVITMDLQSVLLSPKLNASALYYKTKLACHNFTIFDLPTKDVTCYFWHEGEDDLSANSFASCVANYIESAVLKDSAIKHVIVYSDGCGYQNRNVTLTNTLCHISKKHGIQITQNFLEKGHTQMEVDAVHSVVERKIKNKNIYVPQNYVDSIASARPNQPYTVHYVDHGFFRKYSELSYYSSIRPGSKVGDPVVTDLRVLHCNANGTAQYKIAFDDELTDFPRKARITDNTYTHEEPAKLHDGSLKIKSTKYEHLQILKSVIPRDYHGFYDNLNH